MDALRTENTELRRNFQSANARAWALQAQSATVEARLAVARNSSQAPAPIQGIEYNQHTVKARLRGVYAELTVANDVLRSDLGTLRDLQNDPDFLGICQEGTPSGAAFDAIGRVHERLKPSAGLIECGICYETITAETAMLGKNCHHLFCLVCVERNMEAPNADGVGNMRCPYRCAGTFCNRDHWTLFQQAKAEVQSEGDISDVAAAVLDSPDDKFQSLLDAGVLVVVPFLDPSGGRWEEVKDGPQANKRRRGEDRVMNLYKSKDVIKRMTSPFKFAKSEGADAWDALARESGCEKGWVRRVAAATPAE